MYCARVVNRWPSKDCVSLSDNDIEAPPSPPVKWLNLGLLSLASLFALVLWFSASAVVPQLTAEWHLSGVQQSWLTMSVQIGFVIGALVSAAFNLADRISPPRLVAVSALLGALFNGAIPFLDAGATPTILFRFLTGVSLAGVYPPAAMHVGEHTIIVLHEPLDGIGDL